MYGNPGREQSCKGDKIDYNQQNSPNIESWIRLIRADGVGPTTFNKLLKYFGTPQRALGASVAEMARVEGIGVKTAERILRSRDKFNVQHELELAENLGIWIINLEDDRYWPALKKTYDPPPVLYIKGSLERSDNLAIAIVGSRRCSTYGSEQASRFAHMLASAGFTVVSGMARGIDTSAHRGALSANGRTIAVQGCGLTNIFPPENEKLFELIAQSGACISELPLSYEPLAENFPARNRIIAGLSIAVIVVEATPRSGALITAKAAIEQNKEVMAIPGKIDSPVSAGPNRLIKEGARLVDCVEDVMEALGYIGDGLKKHVTTAAQQASRQMETPLFSADELNLSENEIVLYNCLGNEAVHIEDMIAQTGLQPGQINASLISLRLKGLIKQLPGNVFKKN